MAVNAKKKVVKKVVKKKAAPKYDEYTLFYDGQELGTTKGHVQLKVAEPIPGEIPTMRKKWWHVFRRKAITRDNPAQWWGDYVLLRIGNQNIAVPRDSYNRWHEVTTAWGVADRLASELKELSNAAEKEMLERKVLGVVK